MIHEFFSKKIIELFLHSSTYDISWYKVNIIRSGVVMQLFWGFGEFLNQKNSNVLYIKNLGGKWI